MLYLFYAVHVFTCIFLILVVLLQQGKGADLSVFGGGSTQTAFGARGAATLLHKLTVGFFVLFIVTTMSIGILQRTRSTTSVMSDVEQAAEEEAVAEPPEEPPMAPAAEVPQAPEPADGVAPEGGEAGDGGATAEQPPE